MSILTDPMAQRSEELFYVANEVKKHYEEWATDDRIQGLPIDHPLAVAIDVLCATFATGHIPGNTRQLERAVQQLSPLWAMYKAEAVQLGGDPNFQPNRDFWAAVTGVVQTGVTSAPRRPSRIESIVTLDKQGVSDLQIARMKGWKTPDGRWDTDMVQQARENPSLDKLTQDDEINQQITERLNHTQQIADIADKKVATREASENRVAPEAITALARSGMTVEMIAVTKGLTIDEVMRELANAGIGIAELQAYQQRKRTASFEHELPESEVNRLNATNLQGNISVPAEEDYDVDEEFADEAEIIDDVTTRVLTAVRAGLDYGDIAAIIGHGMTYQKVTAIVAKYGQGGQSAA